MKVTYSLFSLSLYAINIAQLIKHLLYGVLIFYLRQVEFVYLQYYSVFILVDQIHGTQGCRQKTSVILAEFSHFNKKKEKKKKNL